jgi:hypothetical protein
MPLVASVASVPTARQSFVETLSPKKQRDFNEYSKYDEEKGVKDGELSKLGGEYLVFFFEVAEQWQLKCVEYRKR